MKEYGRQKNQLFSVKLGIFFTVYSSAQKISLVVSFSLVCCWEISVLQFSKHPLHIFIYSI